MHRSDYDAWENIVTTHHVSLEMLSRVCVELMYDCMRSCALQYVGTFGEAATIGLNAGLDQEGGGGPSYPPVQQGIPAALAVGNITMSQLQTSVSRCVAFLGAGPSPLPHLTGVSLQTVSLSHHAGDVRPSFQCCLQRLQYVIGCLP